MSDVATPNPETAKLIVTELRRQVDAQISASASIDTKAAGLIAATFALVALVIPRVQLDVPCQSAIAFVAAIAVLATLLLLFSALVPRKRRWSNGPTAASMLAFLLDGDEPGELEIAMAVAYQDVRDRNESVLGEKATALNFGVGALIATVVALMLLVIVGGIA